MPVTPVLGCTVTPLITSFGERVLTHDLDVASRLITLVKMERSRITNLVDDRQET